MKKDTNHRGQNLLAVCKHCGHLCVEHADGPCLWLVDDAERCVDHCRCTNFEEAKP